LHAGGPHGRGELGQVRAQRDQAAVLDVRRGVLAPVDLDGRVVDLALPGGGEDVFDVALRERLAGREQGFEVRLDGGVDDPAAAQLGRLGPVDAREVPRAPRLAAAPEQR
jgi:hypothetical protein